MGERQLKVAFLKGKVSLLRDQGKFDPEISTLLGCLEAPFTDGNAVTSLFAERLDPVDREGHPSVR